MLPRPRLRERLGRGLRALAGVLEPAPASGPQSPGPADARVMTAPGLDEPTPGSTEPGADPAWVVSPDGAPEHWLRRVREAGLEGMGLASELPPQALNGFAGPAPTPIVGRPDEAPTEPRASIEPQAGVSSFRRADDTGPNAAGPAPGARHGARSEQSHDLPATEPMRQWPRGPAVDRLRLRVHRSAAHPAAPTGMTAVPGTSDSGAPGTGSPDSGAPDTGAPDTGAPDTAVFRAVPARPLPSHRGVAARARPAPSVVANRLVLRVQHPVEARPPGVHESAPTASEPLDGPHRSMPMPGFGVHARVPDEMTRIAPPPARPAPSDRSASSDVPASPSSPVLPAEWPAPVRSSGPARTEVASVSPHPWPALNVPRTHRDDAPNFTGITRGLARARRLAVEESRV